MRRGPVIVLASILAIGIVVGSWKYLSAAPPSAMTTAASSAAPELAAVLSDQGSLATDASAADAGPAESARTPDEHATATAVPTTDDVGVRGRVRGSRAWQFAIAGARVRFERGDEVLTEKSDLSGAFALEHVTPGSWKISVEAEGFRTWSEERTIPSDQALYTLDVHLDRTNVVLVQFRTPDGRDLGVAAQDSSDIKRNVFLTLAATPDAPSTRLPAARDAMWDPPSYVTEPPINPLVAASYDRHFEFPSALPMFLSACLADVVLDTRYVEKGQAVVTFVIPLATLRDGLHAVRLRVIDEDSGEPLPSATAALLPIGSRTSRGMPVDPNGMIIFEQRPPGLWSLFIEARDYEGLRTPVEIASDGDTDLGTFSLSRGISIEGRFVDQAGTPVTGITWEVVPARETDASSDARVRLVWSSDVTGKFSAKSIDRGQHVIRSASWVGRGDLNGSIVLPNRELRFRPVLVDTSHGSKTGIVVHCQPASPVAFVGDESTADEVRIVETSGLPVAESQVLAGGASTLHLVPGEYIAKLTKHGTLVRSVPFRVDLQDGTQTVDLRQ
jgi:hypothetical protein